MTIKESKVNEVVFPSGVTSSSSATVHSQAERSHDITELDLVLRPAQEYLRSSNLRGVDWALRRLLARHSSLIKIRSEVGCLPQIACFRGSQNDYIRASNGKLSDPR